MAASITATF